MALEHEAIEKIVWDGMNAAKMETDGVPCENPFTSSQARFYFDLGRKIGRAIERGELRAGKGV